MIVLKKAITIFYLLLQAIPCFSQLKNTKPNVILILSDDQGWGDFRSNGNSVVNTPVLDKLAKDGASFSKFYVSPLCAPTRASLLTGRYHLRTGAFYVTKGTETVREEETTIAEALKSAGYATGCFGKWHNGAHFPNHPNGQGFDSFFGFCGGHLTNYFNAEIEYNRVPVKAPGFITDVLTDSAMAFIERNKERPFFCYIPYNTPHSPFQVPDRYFDKYKKLGQDDVLASVYGMVENMDDNIGRILNHVTDLGLENNTIIIFMTDNGPQTYRYNGVMKGKKGDVDEGGVRVPLFIKYPGKFKSGLTINSATAHIDLFPTIMELCGVSNFKTLPLDGISLVPLLYNKTEKFIARSLFTHVSRSDKFTKYPGAVRKDNYLLVLQNKENFLFDLQADPGQKKDMKESKTEVLKELTGKYDEWFKDVTSKGLKRSAIPVVAEVSVIELPAHEAFTSGSLKYMGVKGYAHDWLINWSKDANASCWWELDIKDSGNYEIDLLYNCDKKALGASMVTAVEGKTVSRKLNSDFLKEVIPSPDRVKRIEAFEKNWAVFSVGNLHLSKGISKLILKTPDLNDNAVLEVKAIRLKKR